MKISRIVRIRGILTRLDSLVTLKKYLSVSGKILPRSKTQLTAKEQRALKKAIKTARILGLLPFSNR